MCSVDTDFNLLVFALLLNVRGNVSLLSAEWGVQFIPFQRKLLIVLFKIYKYL